MLFTSWTFAFFLLIFLPLYYLLKYRYQNYLLIVGSYIFYGWWDWRFLILVAFSTIADFLIAQGIERRESQAAKKRFLILSVTLNLTFLGIFKYFNFFADSLASLLNVLGIRYSFPVIHVILPVGISFYTFQAIAYITDVYRGQAKACRNFITYAMYVCYFPQLVAGPIERAHHLLPVFAAPRKVKAQYIYNGLQLMLLGFCKKMVLADSVGPHVNAIFKNPGQYSSSVLILGAILFAIQIYGDFAGYSDIARGVSKLLGIDLMINFRQPYFSRNITEFWRRWHISLSSWLRDYLYIPLGGNRNGPRRTYTNLLTTMFLGGLWHGAAWTYVLWGVLHGLYLALHKAWTQVTQGGQRKQVPATGEAPYRLADIPGTLLTFGLVVLTWIPFRATTMHGTWAYLKGIFSFARRESYDISNVPLWFFTLCAVGLFMLLDLPMFLGDRELLLTHKTPWYYRGLVYAILFLLISFVGMNDAQPFIYFQF